ncbi:3-methyladenine DNA glycosylase AlkD [Arthrobacter ginsengisoli]|uniref:3-methyladenine DNA glycosylase AlkD n=1 Tax=Arthrobacter ginsengisoli TaxID=1356565 RepID=A0ABU1U7I6_9MICC|nr:DNA alkylation repair protein [Arthrobacter ginsengisoli]MDR7081153.1 3-methyladenine DNA glycosylase AlkD [Arthrobacter ginsengisoli]
MANAELMSAIRSRLRAAADPVRGAGAQAYLKSEMPSLGVRVPEVRRIVKTAAKELPPGSLQDLQCTVLELWRGANWREERYAAIDLTGLRQAAGELSMLPLYEEIIRSGAWWDLVDGVSHRLCGLLQTHREDMSPVLRRWSTDADFWIRRAAITSQLGAKSATDPGLLAAVIEPNLADPEFFIRKAIGWALRDYAATDPDWVRDFAARHGEALSPLARREALRKLR